VRRDTFPSKSFSLTVHLVKTGYVGDYSNLRTSPYSAEDDAIIISRPTTLWEPVIRNVNSRKSTFCNTFYSIFLFLRHKPCNRFLVVGGSKNPLFVHYGKQPREVFEMCGMVELEAPDV